MASEKKENAGLLAKIIAIATAEVGVRESNDNSGARVMEYQAADTLGGTHYPWCASFVSWAIREASKATKTKNIWCNSASCDVILAWARKLNIVHTTPQVGDVFLVMVSKYDATHTGIVVAVNGPKFAEISGNTNDTGSRNGDGVYKQSRTNGDRYLFVRWLDLCEAAPLPVKIAVNGKGTVGLFVDGAWRVPARWFGDAVNLKTEWNADHQTVMFNGREFPKQIRMIEGQSWAGINDLAQFANMAVAFDKASSTITIGRGKK